MCQVITPLLKSEWDKAAPPPPQRCWGSTTFIRAEGIILLLARALEKAVCCGLSQWCRLGWIIYSTIGKHIIIIQKRQKRNVWNKLQLNGLPRVREKKKTHSGWLTAVCVRPVSNLTAIIKQCTVWFQNDCGRDGSHEILSARPLNHPGGCTFISAPPLLICTLSYGIH